MTLDNKLSPSLGKEALALFGEARNLVGYGDVLSGSFGLAEGIPYDVKLFGNEDTARASSTLDGSEAIAYLIGRPAGAQSSHYRTAILFVPYEVVANGSDRNRSGAQHAPVSREVRIEGAGMHHFGLELPDQAPKCSQFRSRRKSGRKPIHRDIECSNRRDMEIVVAIIPDCDDRSVADSIHRSKKVVKLAFQAPRM